MHPLKTKMKRLLRYFGLSSKGGEYSIQEYSLESPIHRGADGEVFLGADNYGRKVAVKRSRSSVNSKQELSITKRINSDNCIQPLECFEDSGYAYIVMPYMENGDLFDHIFGQHQDTSANFLHWSIALSHFTQILHGINQIHTRGYVHGDIKLENIFVDQSFKLKIGDFGRSKAYNKRFKSVFRAGTLMYSAPECLLETPIYGPEMDVWSLGVCLYVMLTGCFPFGGNTRLKYVYNICNENFAPIENQKLPREVSRLLEGLLEKNPRKRLTVQKLLRLPCLQPGISF